MRSRLWVILTLACWALGSASSAFAGTVPLEKARQAAENWLTDHLRYYHTWGGSTAPEIVDGEPVTHGGRVVAFNFRVRPQGHIVVPSRDELPPVKFYSETSYLSLAGDSPVALWMKDTELARVYDTIDAQPPDSLSASVAANARLWARFSLDARSFASDLAAPPGGAGAVSLGPLIQTKWDQGNPYNLQTPLWYTGTRTVTGCVATAAAQIMRFWQWPTTGQGSHSYVWNNGQTNQTLSRDFSQSTYDWANMTLTYSGSSTTAQKNAVAKLMADVGVAFEMEYGTDVTWAYTWDGLSVYPDHFKYKSSIEWVSRSDFSSDSAWMQVFRGEVQAGRPSQYEAQDAAGQSGHSFVVDGYHDSPSEQVHFNFGWSGGYDGWFVSNNVPTGGYNWNAYQAALIGIEPAPPCTSFTISPAYWYAGSPSAGSKTVDIIGSPSGCSGGSWTAAPAGGWTSVSKTSGTGPDSLTVSWTQNTGAFRQTSLTIANNSFALDQAGAAGPPACTSFTISPEYWDTGSAAPGSKTVTITGVPSGCTGKTWTAYNNSSWTTVSPNSGSGSGSVTVTWTQNTGALRSTDIPIAGNWFALDQPAGPSIVLDAPVEGEALDTGSTYTIRWTSAHLNPTGSLQLFYSDTSGWIFVASLSPTATQYSWTVPNTDQPTTSVFVGNAVGSAWEASDSASVLVVRPTDFYTVTPCRLVDTRVAGQGWPGLSAGETRRFKLSQACAVPATARAVAVNVTVVGASTAGNIRFFPAGLTAPLVSMVNYGAANARANNGVLTLGTDGSVDVRCSQAFGTVEVVIDAVGYFQ